MHVFCPIAIETSGVFGPDAYAILCDLARRIKDTSSESTQRHTSSKKNSVAVQRGNAASVLGCAGLDLYVVVVEVVVVGVGHLWWFPVSCLL